LSQSQFASRFGFSVRTLQEWEQRREVPTGAARALLKFIAHDPEAVARALA
jgi:putative transcriptional regulator